MSELQQNKNATEGLLNFDFSKPTTNKRITARYVRDDITASISSAGFFSFKKEIFVQLLDIGSKGALISTNQRMNIKRNIVLNLTFATGETFAIKARFVYKVGKSLYRYGIKFDCYNNKLGDYLLETQSKLVIR